MLRTKNKYNFQWEWCDQCEDWFIRCPKCGNNSCNGGSGEVDGEDCDVCSLSHSYQSLAEDRESIKKPAYVPSDEKQKKRIFLVD